MGKEFELAVKKGFSENDLEDILIVEDIKAGKNEAFGKIYDKYYDTILKNLTFLFNGDVNKAEDLTSEVMLKVAKVIGKYSVEGGSGKFGGWINKVAKNAFLDHKRNSKVKFNNSIKSIDETSDLGDNKITLIQVKETNLNIEEQLIKLENDSENYEKLSEALKSLSDIERKIVDLRYFAGLSFKEIGEELGKTENYCLVKMTRAKEKLKNLL
jgi:RNA polymerase sigma-70 factor (ECF subfamily)